MSNPRPKAGRPTELDAPIDVPDGQGGMYRTTVAERIIDLMAQGNYVDTAAASLGILRETLHDWLRIGARCRKAIAKGTLSHPDDPDGEAPLPDTHSLRCMTFSLAVDTASARWLADQEAKLEAATGPRTRTIVTIKTDPKGHILEKTERTEHEGPDLQTLRWRMEKRAPDIYGNRQTIELSGPDGDAIPVDVRVDRLTEKIAALKNTATAEPSTDD